MESVQASRLANLRITRPARSPKAVVQELGAVQAQDYAAALKAVALRCLSTPEAVEAAIQKREIARCWPMRGTLHLIPAEDYFWMQGLSSRRTLQRAAKRHRDLELDADTLQKARRVLANALEDGKPVQRQVLMERLEKEGVSVEGQRGTHILWEATHHSLICFGPREGKQHTFVLAEAWIKNPIRLERDEAVSELARRYFKSHGPATVADFTWWTGLTLADARQGLESIKGELSEIQKSLFGPRRQVRADVPRMILLPAFDEYVIGYTDRSFAVDDRHAKKYVTKNGMFAAVVLVDGVTEGIWKKGKGGPDITWFSDPATSP